MSTVWPLHVKTCNDHHPQEVGDREKEEGGLFGRRRKGVSGVLGGAGKFSVWLVAGGSNGSRGKGERGDFFSQIWPQISSSSMPGIHPYL